MRPFYFLVLILFLSIQTAFAQGEEIIIFEDDLFKNALLNYIPVIDDNGDNEISFEEAQAVDTLIIRNRSIADLTGIEHFTNLTYLDCYYNNLDRLDVSGLTHLETLLCEENFLTSLNVSGLTHLKTLICDDNFLDRLDVRGLSNLELLLCNGNLLPSLDVSGLTNLLELECAGNFLTSIDVSGCTSLESLDCFLNFLTSLDVSGLPNLQIVVCDYNSLISVDLRRTPVFHGIIANGNPDLQCIIVDDLNQLPTEAYADQDSIPYTTESCLATFDGLKNLIVGMNIYGASAAALNATLQLAKESCNLGSKWLAISTLQTFIYSVEQLQKYGQLTSGEANTFTKSAGELRDHIKSGTVDCSTHVKTKRRFEPNLDHIKSGTVDCSTPRKSILGWISEWFNRYNLENPMESNTSNAFQTASLAVQNIYPNPTSGRVNFSRPDQQVVVYNMLGKIMKKAEGVDHIDMTEFQSGVFVIQLTKDKERTVHQVVKK